MKAKDVPAGYVFTYNAPEGADLTNQPHFLKIRHARTNAVNVKLFIAASVADTSEVVIVGKFAINPQLAPESVIQEAETRFKKNGARRVEKLNNRTGNKHATWKN